MTTTYFVITNGPSMDRLVDVFRYTKTPGVEIDAEFSGYDEARKQHHWLHAQVTSLSYTTSRPGEFLMKISGEITLVIGATREKGGAFEATYDATSREGTLTLTPR